MSYFLLSFFSFGGVGLFFVCLDLFLLFICGFISLFSFLFLLLCLFLFGWFGSYYFPWALFVCCLPAPHCTSCRVLIPRPGIKLEPLYWEQQAAGLPEKFRPQGILIGVSSP